MSLRYFIHHLTIHWFCTYSEERMEEVSEDGSSKFLIKRQIVHIPLGPISGELLQKHWDQYIIFFSGTR